MASPTPLLDKIENPADLRKLPSEDLRQLADELRHETISAVSETFMATGESLAHLMCLVHRKLVNMHLDDDGVYNYTTA